MVKNDELTWSMYRRGLTLGLNQMEKDKSKQKVMTYSPRNISEMAAICAGIRPAFQSMIHLLINRQNFSYDIPALDGLLRTKQLPQSFILYQQQMMTVLQWAGFTAPESYASIKAIAKKHPEKVLPLKQRFLAGFKARLIDEQHVDANVAEQTALKVWTIISDACGYGFNSSHATAVALDSIYTAWAKAHYPYETYVCLLRNYSDKGDKDRIDKAKKQMLLGFNISTGKCKFRQDNRDYFVDKKSHTIVDSLTSIKGVGKKDAQAIYRLGNQKFNHFVDLLITMQRVSGALNSGVVETLIRYGYFIQFGPSGKLLKIYDEFYNGENKWADTYKQATKRKRYANLIAYEQSAAQEQLPVKDVIRFEIEKLGSPTSVYPDRAGYYGVLDVDTKYSPKVYLYSLYTGHNGMMKVKKATFANCPLNPGDVIFVQQYERKQAYEYIDDKPVPKKNVYDLWMKKYNII